MRLSTLLEEIYEDTMVDDEYDYFETEIEDYKKWFIDFIYDSDLSVDTLRSLLGSMSSWLSEPQMKRYLQNEGLDDYFNQGYMG